MDLTSDNTYLAIGEFGTNAYYYKREDNSFILKQNITYTEFHLRRIQLTDDHMYMVVANKKNSTHYNVLIYKYNNETDLFEDFIADDTFIT